MNWREACAYIGIFLFAANLIGIAFDIYPFRIHPDYTKDPCCGSASTRDRCAYPDEGHIFCLRANPEINMLPSVIGLLLFIPCAAENNKEAAP